MRDIDWEELVVVAIERKDSLLWLIGPSLEESERSIKNDLDSGDDANGSTETKDCPLGADGVEGLPVDSHESRARSSGVELLSTFNRRLRLLVFLDLGSVENEPDVGAFSSAALKGIRSKSLDENEESDILLSAVSSTEREVGLETSIDTGLLCLRCCLERKILKVVGGWGGAGASSSVSLLSEVVE